MPKVCLSNAFRQVVVVSVVLLLQTGGQKLCAQETKSVFELDCVNFAGRFLSNAPVKKKAHPGLAVDGTTWAMGDDKRVLITKVFPGEAAEKAGLEAGDEIISVNGYAVASAESLRDLFCSYHMYDTDAMTETLIVRKKGGANSTVKLELLPIDKCNPEEKTSWLDVYKKLGF